MRHFLCVLSLFIASFSFAQGMGGDEQAAAQAISTAEFNESDSLFEAAAVGLQHSNYSDWATWIAEQNFTLRDPDVSSNLQSATDVLNTAQIELDTIMMPWDQGEASLSLATVFMGIGDFSGALSEATYADSCFTTVYQKANMISIYLDVAEDYLTLAESHLP